MTGRHYFPHLPNHTDWQLKKCSEYSKKCSLQITTSQWKCHPDLHTKEMQFLSRLPQIGFQSISSVKI